MAAVSALVVPRQSVAVSPSQLGPTVTVTLDGRPISAYVPARLEHGEVIAPVEPYVTRIATSVDYTPPYLTISRGSRHTRILLLDRGGEGTVMLARVVLAPIARALGFRVSYESHSHRLELLSPARLLQTPEPFQSAAPQPLPTSVFTPMVSPTPRPLWSGSPLPRRTPLPGS